MLKRKHRSSSWGQMSFSVVGFIVQSGWMQTDMSVLPDQLPAVTGGKPGAWMSMICCLAAALNFMHKSCISIGEGWHILGALQFLRILSRVYWQKYTPYSRSDCQEKVGLEKNKDSATGAPRLFLTTFINSGKASCVSGCISLLDRETHNKILWVSAWTKISTIILQKKFKQMSTSLLISHTSLLTKF